MNETIVFTGFKNTNETSSINTEFIKTLITLMTPFLLLIALALYFVLYCYKQTVKFLTQCYT